jgi:hypothetical protein
MITERNRVSFQSVTSSARATAAAARQATQTATELARIFLFMVALLIEGWSIVTSPA